MPHTSVVDVLLVLVRDGQVLLAERAGTGYADGCWNVPSGKLEAGEDAVTAMRREALEEIGVELAAGQLLHVATVQHRNAEGQTRFGLFFLADGRGIEPANAEPHKCARIGWFAPDALPPNTYSYTAAGIASWQKGETFALDGWDLAAPAGV